MKGPATLLMLAGVLAGCTLLPGGEAVPPQPPPAPLPAPEAEPPPPAPVPVPPTAALVLGKDAAAVQAILGHPVLVRREDGVQVMQFANGHCVLDVFLYRHESDARFVARHLAARTPAGERLEPADCLALLVPKEHWPLAPLLPQADFPG
ncbi:MAG: hypothetical protein D6807_05985 [Alphaproteobacteria bacterium]|nr:MAG: hypothetical protein D6807_05985 [Alphaproteobacteria bacterium]